MKIGSVKQQFPLVPALTITLAGTAISSIQVNAQTV